MDTPNIYIAALHSLPGITHAKLKKLVESSKTAQHAWEKLSSKMLTEIGMEHDNIDACLERRSNLSLEKLIDYLTSYQISVVMQNDIGYPSILLTIPQPPYLLYIRGTYLDSDMRLPIAFVGTRKATSYGRDSTQRLIQELAAHQPTIISGLAYGIDSIAHEAALANSLRTIGVLGGGVDVIYPKDHTHLGTKIIENGCLISEFPLGTQPMPFHFPLRNRIISGLSKGVVIIEAQVKSGSLITAEVAIDQNKEVFAVPGDTTRDTSAGTNMLIQKGQAKLTTCGKDILEEFGFSEDQMATRTAPVFQSALEERVYQALGPAPKHVDELTQEIPEMVFEISSCLSMLELRGVVRQREDTRWYLV